MLQLSRIRKNVAIGQKRARETKLDLKSSVRKCSRNAQKSDLVDPKVPNSYGPGFGHHPVSRIKKILVQRVYLVYSLYK